MMNNLKWDYEFKSFYDYFTQRWVIKQRIPECESKNRWVLHSSKLYDTQSDCDEFIRRELINKYKVWQR